MNERINLSLCLSPRRYIEKHLIKRFSGRKSDLLLNDFGFQDEWVGLCITWRCSGLKDECACRRTSTENQSPKDRAISSASNRTDLVPIESNWPRNELRVFWFEIVILRLSRVSICDRLIWETAFIGYWPGMTRLKEWKKCTFCLNCFLEKHGHKIDLPSKE